MPAPLPSNEADRLAALYELHVLDTAPENDFDDIVKLASTVCGVPMSLVSLIDIDRQWFKAKIGTDLTETPARPVLLRPRHPRPGPARRARHARPTRGSPTTPRSGRTAGIRFYAGAPLITSDGFALGTLCVLDSRPRTLDVEQLQALRALARQVTSQLELRRYATALANTTARLQELERRKDDLAGLVGGELRAPLRLMRSYLADLGNTGHHDAGAGRPGRPRHRRARPRASATCSTT